MGWGGGKRRADSLAMKVEDRDSVLWLKDQVQWKHLCSLRHARDLPCQVVAAAPVGDPGRGATVLSEPGTSLRHPCPRIRAWGAALKA